ncbi:MAG: DNA polymerase II large subunit [Candidatus Pacearchaeota archaeon]|jgi:DNA polymerase II large subunit
MDTKQYFKNIESETKKIYEVAERARAKGLDPQDKVEIPLARSLAEKVVGLISTLYPQMMDSGIVERMIELEKKHGKLDPAVCLQIAEEISKQKFCKFASLKEAIEAGARTGVAYITLGVVSSPIEGLTEIKICKTRDGKEYLSPYYSGPIRSAGGSGAAFSLVIVDYLRELFGYSKYDPTEDEIKRSAVELHDYHERITNLQYMPTDDESKFLAANIPVQINGEPSETLEVSNYKNLERVETNLLRGGFCLVLGEGIAQKAKKIARYISSLKKKGFKLSDWEFLDEYVKLHERRDMGKTDASPTYIQDLVAGRPVFGHPSESGAFRFRYGRGRSSGFSATSIHPATMEITDEFIAIGTQLKIEKPTKGCIVTSCDSIDGPIVKLYNGSVKKINTKEEAKKLYADVEEIIYLGDILFPFSDVANRNANLLKPGYVEEFWKLELREKNPELEKTTDPFKIDFEKAIEISNKEKISLNPKYIFYWTEISKEQLLNLIDWLKQGKTSKKIILPFTKSDQEKFGHGKRALELLGIEHDFVIEHVIINQENSKAMLANLGTDFEIVNEEKELRWEFEEYSEKIKKTISENPDFGVLELINSASKLNIRNKAGDFIGARMGRPEKAKLRKLTGSPNVLFPVGEEGGRLRSFQSAVENGSVSSVFPIYKCEKCNKETIYRTCETCGEKSRKMFYCPECGINKTEKCEQHKNSYSYSNNSIDMNYYFESAREKLGLSSGEIPPLIKGVRGTMSEGHIVENLSKGILRAMFDLQVNKDGTIRFDATEMPLVAFKPKEIGVSVEKLREIGYDKDINGEELVNDNQILELMPHDILLPSSPESPDGRADDIFMRICHFVDDMLVKLYRMEPIYNVRKREDLVGKIGVCIAPHNCAGVVCRIIGFSNTLGMFASPFMHAAIRRDCDGDEAAIMLLGDVLINFSREFLPQHRGGNQDSPLVLNAKIDAGEVDDQIMDFELVKEYPIELYRLAEERKHSSEVSIKDVRKALKNGDDPFQNIFFTHNTENINDGVACSSYKLLETMQDKVNHQMELVEKIRAANTSETARLIIERHFLRDMRGNLRKFSMQEFRCVACNEIMRRPPLTGFCPKCGGRVIFTTNEGGIKKYLEPALNLAKKYNLSSYIKQSLELTKRQIDSLFGKEIESQENLGRWF